MGLAYATVMVLGLYRPSDQEPLGLPSRQSGEGGQVTAIGPIDVQAEDGTLSSSSASPSASAPAGSAPSKQAGAPPASPVTDESVNEAAAPPPASDENTDDGPAAAAAPPAEAPDPDSSSSSGDEDDDEGKLIDVNLLGIHIAI